MAAIRAAPKDRMNWMTSCTFALTRAHSYWARFAQFMVTVWLRSGPPVRLQVILVILVPKCCLFATVAAPAGVGEGQYKVAGGARCVDQFKSINKQLNTATPAPGAGATRALP